MRIRSINVTNKMWSPVLFAAMIAIAGMLGCATGNPGPGDNDCGNLQLDDGEECDDGNTFNEDGCSATCQVEDCGDGVVQTALGEECDDGNTDNGDGCNATCEDEHINCGNDHIDAGEECDDGNTDNGDGCSSTCLLESAPVCGNGTVEGSEQCDDGNTTDGDGCSASCMHETPVNCGDGNVDTGEECDDGNTDSEDGCSALCVIETCGDGIVQTGLNEECDDGNTADGDGCSAACLTESSCGNGTRQPGEECDDGNLVDNDGCSATCQLDQLVLQPGPADGKDSQVYSLQPDTNYPDATYSWAQAWTWSSVAGTRRSYFEFPLPAAMNGCTVASATLQLYHNPMDDHSGLSGNTLETEIYRITQAWDEQTITWNNQPNVDSSFPLALPPPAGATSDAQVDLTAMVSYWFANPGSNHGFLWRLQTEVHYRQVIYTSSDYVDDPLRRPALLVDFSSCP